MKLAALLERVEYECVQGSLEKDITGVVYDSRKALAGGIFICIRGAVSDGHKYVDEVVGKGITAVIVEEEVTLPDAVTVIRVKDSRQALACISAAWFGHPAEKLKTIGITGTKGKTTTAYMVKSILESAGYKTGLIGTIEIMIGEERIPAKNTTPESYVVQETFAKMVEEGCQCVVMEVSSQGLMLHRVGGFVFDYGVFTNLAEDHIGPNEHKDMEDYIHCKSLLFQQCRHGILNMDDTYLEQILKDHTCEVETFGFYEEADLYAESTELIHRPGFLGVSCEVRGSMNFSVEIDIPGGFSVYNSLAAIAVCHHFNVPVEKMAEALGKVQVKGRVEFLKVSEHYKMLIDYAHNAMSLECLLATLEAYHPKRLVCLFGCGGNRAKSRRYEMGEVSSRLADLTVITSDNPRNEDPEAIIADILEAVKKADGKYVTIPDRKEAIRYCMEHAQEGDVIVLAGKGHEDYQEIKGVKYPMDERVLVREIIEEADGKLPLL
jgi:UDP-N-acetylmuramoyl-L-alanyl-D-glutamate--2,6-diaminopimelate ligase